MRNTTVSRLYGVIRHPSPAALRLMRTGYTLAEWAGKLDVGADTASNWERGLTVPGPHQTGRMIEKWLDYARKTGLPGIELLALAQGEKETRPHGTD